MLTTNSYDTICHEHLLYFTLHDLKSILERVGFKITDASLNAINGGSIAITAIKSKSDIAISPYVEYLLDLEIRKGYRTDKALKDFAQKALDHREELSELIDKYVHAGYKVVGLGASTKGNVLLQWLNISRGVIQAIGDINKKKFGNQCPGTGIPIVSEKLIIQEADGHTVALVLPWHFRESITENCEEFLVNEGKLLFPLPNIQVVAN